MKVEDLHLFKQKALQWAGSFDSCCCLDSNDYQDPYGAFDFLIAAGIDKSITHTSGNAFGSLKSFYDEHRNWMFGLLGYDLKNETETLNSANTDELGFPDLFFFIPQYLFVIAHGEIKVLIGNEEDILDQINNSAPEDKTAGMRPEIMNRIAKDAYIKTVKQLQQHILKGDLYEVNFCQEFFARHASIDPLGIYRELNKISPTPFSGFFKIKDRYILSASPERFICKRQNRLISQPIKGTAKRSADPVEDESIKVSLQQDEKERAENVMIVDLVRNDLTKSAVKGSVKVEELFGIYGFRQVYQMISTVSAELAPEVHIVDVLKNAFPMGSMTGAPKVKAMELIEQYESSKRGAYSGSFGYITPDGDFDFNVVIRSILYDAGSKYLSFQVGGAITYAADAEQEYKECLLKAEAIMQTLGH
ncbi:anthranilate synthase component I family protein [Pedobacter frigoris]|uniref:anthranilate synthase component I family protein n=1 Tax=Pedobacter frigoris TaxID=2571272 RepID=UPI002930E3A5|nr:anthranilate synthase component I family protein [Pedobacter frigoris]